MESQDIRTVLAMKSYGGSFVQSMAALAMHADPENLGKIKVTWPIYWREYEMLGIKLYKQQTDHVNSFKKRSLKELKKKK